MFHPLMKGQTISLFSTSLDTGRDTVKYWEHHIFCFYHEYFYHCYLSLSSFIMIIHKRAQFFFFFLNDFIL